MAEPSPTPDEPEALERYRSMRDFDRTPEPAGATPAPSPGGGNRFVVQRHRARRLHYDLRLEADGVLASWAVPKGPPLDPKVRALAVHVEDHPLEYYDFEGVIPKGGYGAGDVIVWDWGTWTPSGTDDPAAAIADGDLHFDLSGEKLAGRFVLVRRGRPGGAAGGSDGSGSGGKEQWLLLHKNDEHAVPGWDPEDHPHSVKTGRTNDEVAAAPEALWRSDQVAAEAAVTFTPAGGGDGSGSTGPASRPTWDGPTDAELAALDALGAKGRWELQGRVLALTNLDKVLFPAVDGDPGRQPVTKRDLIRYHACVAPTMLPYLEGRPVNLHRYPDGVDRPGFWHKEVPSHAPDWLTRWHYDDADPDETQWYSVIDHPATLAWMANFGAVELHPWTSRIPYVREPTWAYVDIDPGPANSFDDVVVLARLYRTALDHLGVLARPKVTGRRGIQIWIPIRAGYTFDDTREWVHTVSKAVGATVPELISWAWKTKDRDGRARLDYTQNAVNKTLVAPYSARPAPGAPVSVPLEWDELDDPDLAPDRWTVRTVLDRIATIGDPFACLVGVDQSLPPL
jgi:bifunctional non-homologous end joining protein LigD